MLDHQRGRVSESSISIDQGYQTLKNLARLGAVQALMLVTVRVEGQVALEPGDLDHTRFPFLGQVAWNVTAGIGAKTERRECDPPMGGVSQ